MIGKPGTIDKLGCQSLINDLTAEQVEFLSEFIREFKYARLVKVMMVFRSGFRSEMEFEMEEAK